MTASAAAALMTWEAQGRQAASRLEGVHSAVIAGRDPLAVAAFAIGIARVHGATRRVAIADLIGELPPLQSLVSHDDPHGISDSFLYGVSLNKIAVPIDGSTNVFLMPSGTESVTIESVYNNERWRRLSAGFHQVGALLLIVAAADTPGFTQLCEFVGSVVPVGDVVFAVADGVNVISNRRPTPPPTERTAARALASADEDPAMRRRKLIVITTALLAGAIAVGTLWPKLVTSFQPSPSGAQVKKDSIARSSERAVSSGDTALAPAAVTGSTSVPVVAGNGAAPPSAPSPDSATTASQNMAQLARAVGAVKTPVVVENPQDSLHSAAFSVYLSAGKTARDATPDNRVQSMSIVSVSPLLLGADPTPWFRTTVGATDDITQAQSLLAQLRGNSVLGQTSGSIIRVPYAFRLADAVRTDSASVLIKMFGKRGVAAYALRQNNGRAVLYTGAYETPQQAMWFADSLRVAGIPPVLVFRTGRAF